MDPRLVDFFDSSDSSCFKEKNVAEAIGLTTEDPVFQKVWTLLVENKFCGYRVSPSEDSKTWECCKYRISGL